MQRVLPSAGILSVPAVAEQTLACSGHRGKDLGGTAISFLLVKCHRTIRSPAIISWPCFYKPVNGQWEAFEVCSGLEFCQLPADLKGVLLPWEPAKVQRNSACKREWCGPQKDLGAGDAGGMTFALLSLSGHRSPWLGGTEGMLTWELENRVHQP